MADYTREPQRFFYNGVSLVPEDALAQGKVSFAQNMRSYEDGTLTPRWGSTRQSSSPLGSPVHSLFRLTDTSQAGGGVARRFAGSGTTLYSGNTTPSAYAARVTGQSGNPLTAVAASPAQSPRSYLYVGDSVKMRKLNVDLVDYSIGLPPPKNPPTATLAAVQTTFLESLGAGNWVSYGVSTPVGAVPISARIAATTTQVIYDTGTTGMACIALDIMQGIVAGITVDIDTETVIAQDVYPAVSPTTIGRIIYDSGASGACTIQPQGSFTVGQIEAAWPPDIIRRYKDLGLPAPPKVTVSRTVDFPVNCLVTLGGVETVRIESVAMGQDGTQSFRCTTSGTHVAGEAIDGVASFRAYTVGTHVVGEAATADMITNTITPPSTAAVVGGVQAPVSGGLRNWGLVGTQATQPDDRIRFAFRISQFAYLESVRLMLDVDIGGGGPTTFLENYYFYEWRSNDLLTAVQATQAAVTGSVVDAQTGAVTTGQVTGQYGIAYGGSGGQSGPYGTFDTGYTPTDGYVTAGSVPPRQLSLGDGQWVVLECRVGDLTRVGTDVTRTLTMINSAAITMQIKGTTSALTCDFSDAYLTGGYGPDVGTTLPPYVYRYRYRSTITGETGNPSPPMRGGVHPHRGRVVLQAQNSTEAQCDTIDWFRYGGALVRWQYTGSQPNSNTPFNDDNADTALDGGETLRTDLFQPWPSFDLPRTGTAELAGTSLKRVSGDLFDPSWAADSLIVVNGRATTLYQQPASTSQMQIVDNCGEGAAVTWSMPSPTVLGQALPAIWGGPVNDVWFNFACGAAADPSQVHWTHGNDPDATSDANTLTVSSASEPLQNGCMFDGFPYVFSTERLYRLSPTFGQLNTFRVDETPCQKGLWSRWFLAVSPEGMYFGNKDGIYLTTGGGAVSITDDDLQVLFPQDGSADTAPIRGLSPIDFTAITKLKLAYVDGTLYFDYQDILGASHTFLYDPVAKRWTPDVYASGVTSRISEPGPQVHTNLYGCANGQIYQADAAAMSDDGTAIAWAIWTPWANGGDARMTKQFGDAVVDAVPGQGGYTATPVYDNGTASVAGTVVAGSAVRTTSLVEVSSGVGVLSRNFGLKITGSLTDGGLPRPLLYLWEPAFLAKQTIIARRATDWENLGYTGAKFVQGVVIRANTFNVQKAVDVQYEGGHIGASLTLLHQGETQYAYPIRSTGWVPFVAELVRLVGTDDNPWMLLDWRWIWEPAPEAATQWQTQETTFDMPGFIHATDAVIAYQSHCPVTLTVWHENGSEDYILPATNDIYLRYHLWFTPAKGKWVRFRLIAGSPFRVFAKDTKVRVGAWGIPGGYLHTIPFGGPSRAVGAEV